MLRTVYSREEHEYLFSSSYQAGEGMGGDDQVIRGFEMQAELVVKALETILDKMIRKGQSCIVEGVHLSSRLSARLMTKHKECIPFLIYISNEAKHTERFAIRAKYMALEPRLNRYVKFFASIRQIQDHLCAEAEGTIPMIDNTNIDRSLAIIHMSVISFLSKGDLLECVSDVQNSSWSAKDMLRIIREKKKRHEVDADLLLALDLESLGS
jgi:2-phosphoglycerate kinase